MLMLLHHDHEIEEYIFCVPRNSTFFPFSICHYFYEMQSTSPTCGGSVYVSEESRMEESRLMLGAGCWLGRQNNLQCFHQ